MHRLFQLLNAIYPLSEELVDYLSKKFEYYEVKKGDYLLKKGQVCRHLFFIDEGLVRCFYYRGNKEICAWFQTEGNAVISFDSFYNQVPATEYIEALEDCKLYRITHADLQYMYKTYLESNIHRAALTEQYYQTVWKCFYNTRLTTAKERYQFFIENFPHWASRVPKKDIAAFLGVSEHHFSRIRV